MPYISLIVHFPATSETRRELSKRVAAVHAQVVMEKIKLLSCPAEQKIALIDHIVAYGRTEDGA